ncbi:ubiquitin domain-containing protein UBFD1-like [Diadema setosum]|uniref:ubiquitin domain-containing protein UBFD1-like n=1 Tax=Diadema setosum TaxID=31175 RepID=UPI003B3B17DA
MEQSDDSNTKTNNPGGGDAGKCQMSEESEAQMETQVSDDRHPQTVCKKEDPNSRTENSSSSSSPATASSADTTAADTAMEVSTDNNKDSVGGVSSNGSVSAGRSPSEGGGQTGGAAADRGEPVNLKVMYNKKKYDVRVGVDSTVTELKAEIQNATGVPPAMQKLMFKGLMKDEKTLRELKVTNGAKLMLIGSTLNDVLEVTKPVVAGASAEKEEKASTKEPLCQQKMHKKILDKGKPEDVMIGIKNKNDPLPNVPISGMLNKAGGKVRLTFKLELDQLWIGTKERTEKIHMNSIKNVLSEAIEGHEDYHIMAIQLGPTEASRYWIYWVPAQFAKAIKDTILGKWVYF